MNRTIPMMDELWDHLLQSDLANGEQPELPASNGSSMPWYVSALVGISGWVAAAFLMLFLSATGLIDNETAMLIVGLVFCVVALGVKYGFRDAIFPSQLAFALSLAGQGLIIGSQFEEQSTLVIVITVLILEGVLFLLYPDGLHRLISLLAMITAVIVQLVDSGQEGHLRWLVLLLAAAALLIWHNKNAMQLSRLRDYFEPLALGLPLAALGLSILPLFGDEFVTAPWWVVALGAGLLLLVLGGLVLSDLKLPLASAAGVGIGILTLLLLIPGYQTPGVLVATLILGIAFWHRQRQLMAVGIVGFALFLGFYYYNLELTLLTKSVILMGTGVALLGLRLASNRLFGGETQ